MTISGTYVPDKYNVQAAQTDFSISFEFVEDSHIAATITDQVTGADTVLTNPTDFTIFGTTLTTVAQQTVGDQITIFLDMPFLQSTVYNNTGDLDLDNIEDDYDVGALERQQLNEADSRSVKVPITDDTDPADLIEALYTAETDATAAAAAAAVSESNASDSEIAAALSETNAAASESAASGYQADVAQEGADQIVFVEAAGDAELVDIGAAGDAELVDVGAEGDTQVARVEAAGDATPPFSLVTDLSPSLGGNLDSGSYKVINAALQDTSTVGQNLGSLSSNTALTYPNGEVFIITIAASLTFTFINPPANNRLGIMILEITNGGAHTITWPTSVEWDGGSAPSLQASGVDIITFITRDAGTTWRAVRGWKEA